MMLSFETIIDIDYFKNLNDKFGHNLAAHREPSYGPLAIRCAEGRLTVRRARNRACTKERRDIALQTAQNPCSVFRNPNLCLLPVPLTSNFLEGVLGTDRVRSISIRPCWDRSTPSPKSLRTSSHRSRASFKLVSGWTPRDKPFLLPCKAVLQPPPSSAGLGDLKIQATGIKQPQRFSKQGLALMESKNIHKLLTPLDYKSDSVRPCPQIKSFPRASPDRLG